MDRFVSHFTSRFDAKGRVSIPAPFRAVLARDGFDGLYVHPSLDGPALDCGGHALLTEIDGLLARFPPYSSERDTFSVALLGTSDILKLDTEGRVMLSDALKSAAQLQSEATFVGVGYKFQIWEPNAFNAHLQTATTRLRVLRASLSVGIAGAPPEGSAS